MRRTLVLLGSAILLAGGLAALPGQELDAQAQGRPRHPPAAAKDAGGTAQLPRDGGTPEAIPSRPAPVDGGIVEQKTLDGGTRVFKFGELEVEGRLRGPQIVYFLRRVRAEFAAGDLGHRSFMGELSQTRHASAF